MVQIFIRWCCCAKCLEQNRATTNYTERQQSYMNGLKILLFCSVLSLAPSRTVEAQQLAIVQQIQPYFVNADSVSVSNETAALESLERALLWWYTLAPDPIAYEILPPKHITITSPYNPQTWLAAQLTFESDVTEVYIIANRNELLLQEYAGVAMPAYNALAVVEHSVRGLDAALTHELGHVLYGLPDWTPQQCSIDIMCYSAKEAYEQNRVGCLSLAHLGKPCQKIFIPAVLK